MRETNYLQIVTSGLHRTAGPYRCANHPTFDTQGSLLGLQQGRAEPTP
jgi:hypothetical protein